MASDKKARRSQPGTRQHACAKDSLRTAIPVNGVAKEQCGHCAFLDLYSTTKTDENRCARNAHDAYEQLGRLYARRQSALAVYWEQLAPLHSRTGRQVVWSNVMRVLVATVVQQ